MKAVFHTATAQPWGETLGRIPWPLLPVANRPLVDYWLEACAEQGIVHVQLVCGEGADEIEAFAGDGSRWGLKIDYRPARSGESPLDFLRADARCWNEGLFYVGAPVFLRRRRAFKPSGFQNLQACRCGPEGQPRFLFGRTGAEVEMLLDGAPCPKNGLEQIHVQCFAIDSVSAWFDLNMKLAEGEFTRYVTAGFSDSDCSSIGYNVITPPSVRLRPPVLIGNNCHFGAMSTIGGNAVVGDHVVVDSRTELENCVILRDTYIGRNLEIKNKIVSGNRLIDPADGTVVEIDDSWLVARNRRRGFLRK